MEINKLRKEIDAVDEELLTLFLKRMELVAAVAEYKKSKGLSITDSRREEEILAWATANAGDLKGDVRTFFTLLMDLSKERQTMINAKASPDRKVYGLLGEKLSHSFSVPLHRYFGNEDYRLIEVAPTALGAFFRRNDIGGTNVTIPYKQAAMAYCTSLSDEAKATGCVNTMVSRDQGLYGDNTDVAGFYFMLEQSKMSLTGKKVLIFGSGGASLTVQTVAKREKAAEITVISRSGSENYGNLERHRDAEILINATPLGMYPKNGIAPVQLDDFPHCQGVLDLVYHPRRTALLLAAEDKAIPCCGGLPMLVAQAKAAEELFFGCKLDEGETLRALRELALNTGNIVLLSLPHREDSAVAEALAAESHRSVIDINAEMEKASKEAATEIGAARDEASFCRIERECIEKYGKESGLILMVPCDRVKDDGDMAALRQNGCLYLLAPAGGSSLPPFIKEVPGDEPLKAAAAIWQDYCEKAAKIV